MCHAPPLPPPPPPPLASPTYQVGIVDVQSDDIMVQGQHLQMDLFNAELERDARVVLEPILLQYSTVQRCTSQYGTRI